MNDQTPTLEAGFVIDPGDSFSTLKKLSSLIDQVMPAAVRQAASLEAATKNMVDLGGATASVTAFGAAVTKVEQQATQSLKRVENQGESLVSQLNRLNQNFGLNSDQIRANKVETAALAAEQKGLTDLANRLRDGQAQLTAQQAAAAVQAEAEAQALRDAAQAFQMFEAAARSGLATWRDQEAEQQKMVVAAERLTAVLDPLGATQQKANGEIAQADQLFAAGLLTLDQYAAAEARTKAALDATTASLEQQVAVAKENAAVPIRSVGVSTSGTGDFIGAGSAQASAAAIKELMDAEDQLAARVKALTAAVDPQAAALERANALVAEARDLDDGTAAAATRLAQAEKLAADAAKGHGSALGFNSTQAMIAEGAIHRYVDSLAAGMSPGRAFMLQAGDIGNILAMDDKGVAGGLEKVRALINPFTVGLALGTAALVAGGVAALGYANALDRMSAIAQGSGAVIGTTGADLEAIAEKAAAAGNVSVAASRDIVSGYVQAGGIGKDVLGGLVDLTEKFAKATGQDAAGAQHELAAAFQDPVKGAEDLTTRYGSLTQAQIEHIRQLVDANDKYGAQAALLAALGPQFDGAAEHANVLAQAWHGIEVAASNAWTSMGRAIALALGGGSEIDQLADLQNRRAMLLASNANGLVGQVDQQIAALKAKMAQEQAAAKAQTNVQAGNSVVQVGMSIAGASTGAAEVDGLRAKLSQLNAALATMKARGQDGSAAFGQLTTAQQQYQHAVDTYLPSADKAAKAAALDAQAEATKDPVQKRALATQKSLIDQSGQLITGAQAQAKATADGAKAYQQAQNTINSAADAAAKKAANHAAELARSAAAEESQIKNLGLLAAAYGQSGAAALIAEATEKAESKAIKDRGDIEAETDRQIRLAVAQRIADAARSTAAMNEQAGVQEAVNAQVSAGLIPQARAAQAVQNMIALLPIQAAQQAAQQRANAAGVAGDTLRQREFQAAADDATDKINQQTAAQQRLNAARIAAQFSADTTAGGNQIAQLQAELAMIGQTDAARAHELATIRAEQEAKAKLYDPEKTTAYVAQQVQIADLQVKLSEGQAAYNEKLNATATAWDGVAQSAQDAASGMTGAFGAVENAVGSLTSTFAGLQAQEAKMATEERERIRAVGDDYGAQQQIIKEYATKVGNLQVKAYGDALDAAKGFFKQGSAGYKAMETAEKAYRVYQLAVAITNAAREIGLIGGVTAAKVAASATAISTDTATTVASVANSGTRAAADGAAAVAKTASSVPFPANIAAVAAVVALLAGFGVAMLGHGGGGGSAAPTNSGTGTVFGDDKAQSESISNSIDALKDVDTTMLSTSREMLSALKSINSQIGQLSNTVIAAGSIGSIVGVSNSGGGLFGTSKKVTGTGINGGGQTFAQIDAKGYYGADYYADVQKTSSFLGIKTGSSTSTKYADAGHQLEQQFGQILDGFADTVKAAAGPLGVATDTVTQRLSSFVVSIGKIDLTGLSGDDIQKKLQAVFSAEGDKIAQAVLPGLQKYEQAGEGYLQTLTRVVSTIETVTSELDKLGTSTANLSTDAKMGIAGQFDSLSDFSDAADAYFQTYYTDAEQAAAKTAQLGKVFDSLGVAMPKTDADFRKLVEAQDLTTSSGQKTYATLLQVAPAFADLQQSMQGAKSAADILSEQQDLQKQLWEAEGDTADLRAAELATIDPSNRALQQRIYDLQDEQAATQAATQAAQAAAQAQAAIDQQRSGLEQQLLQLQGDTVVLRQRELAALDPTNQALQQQIYDLTDLQAAQAAAAQAAAAAQQAADQAAQEAAQKAASIAQERDGLEGQLLQLQGNTVALRQRELAALDPTNRALQQQIYTLTDYQASLQAAEATYDAIMQQRSGIEDQLLQLTGDVAAQRAKELAALDPSNRALQQQVYALQDQQAATEAATQASEAAAQAEQAIAQERDGLMQQLYQLTGNTAALRAMQLASLDPSNRALQQQIWAISDAQDAAKAAQDLADAWKSIGDSILDEVNRIRGLTDASTGTSTSTFASLQGQFNAAITAAKGGDQDAAKGLPDLSKSLLDAASSAATSRQELARIEAQTAAALTQVYSLINGGVTASNTATSSVLGPAANDTGGSSPSATDWWDTFAATTAANASPNSNAAELAEIRTELAGMRADLIKGIATVAGNTGKLNTNIDNAVRKGGGQSLSVKVAA